MQQGYGQHYASYRFTFTKGADLREGKGEGGKYVRDLQWLRKQIKEITQFLAI